LYSLLSVEEIEICFLQHKKAQKIVARNQGSRMQNRSKWDHLKYQVNGNGKLQRHTSSIMAYYKNPSKRVMDQRHHLQFMVSYTLYFLSICHQNVGQNRDTKIANRSFGNLSQFKYLGTTVTNQNLIQVEIKRRLNSGNACYHSVQNGLLPKNVKIRIYKTIILPVVLYGCETWSLTLREEHGLMVFENRVLRRIFGPKSDEVTGEWRKLHNEELRDVYSSTSIIRIIESRRMRWAGRVARMGRRETHIGYWWESQRERAH
jgi:hypothetical protein